ncbi:glycoside hydrolase [Robertkochia solimangrovi]|nr:glycoside hydrolase [Robertkochia solimangrovi]
MNGISLVSTRDSLADQQALDIKNINANYVAVMPYAFIADVKDPQVYYDTNRQWFGERKIGIRQYIQCLKKGGLKVMLKPHVWVQHGIFTGDMEPDSEKAWQKLEDEYTKYILDFARVAEDEGVEVFCIGNELNKFAVQRSEYFKTLIASVRVLYSGKITYAENWDSFESVDFWEDLDYIGVNAYYPLSQNQTPLKEELFDSWKNYKKKLKHLSYKEEKPVLFTEYGYRSMDHSTREPWYAKRITGRVNHTAQSVALEAIHESFWNENWFAGGFLWKWFPDRSRVGGLADNRFTVQNKPAEMVIKSLYKKR